MVAWAYSRGRRAYLRCVGDHLGIPGNPTSASPEVLASFNKGYADASKGD